ncbi:MAG: hypothetical protein HY820_32780 [Acidobacteria bacterium]|nr:hypothetical protein [Acidobacteriota bacterium]
MNTRITNTINGLVEDLKNHRTPLSPSILGSVQGEGNYIQVRDAYFAEYNPVGPMETLLVNRIVNARWRVRCARNQAPAIMNAEMARTRDALDARCTGVTPELRQVFAMLTMHPKDTAAINSLERDEMKCLDTCSDARRRLIKLQTQRLGHPPVRNPQPASGTLPYASSQY